MKTHFVLGAIFTSLIAMSCSNQESLDGMLTESQSLSAPHRYGIPCNSNVITKDDAAFVADKFMEHPTSRGVQHETTYLYNSDGDKIGYIINYDKGYCIVSSSKDLPPILAYSDEGRFDINNIALTGLSVWSDNLSYSLNKLTEEERASNKKQWDIYESNATQSKAMNNQEKTAALNKRLNEIHEEFGMSVDPRPLFAFKGSGFISDSYYEMFKSKGGSEEYTIVAWYKKDLGTKVKPMVTTQWNQSGALGKYADNKLAGCTVVAAGQLMNYFQYPQSYDWNAIASNNYNNEAIALLSKDIQNKFKVKYGTNGTSSTISNVKEGLEDFGYSVKESEELYSFRLIEKYHQPLYEQGINEAGIGHAWVVDGYETFDYQYYYIVEYLRGSAGNYYYERDNTTYSADDGNLVVPTLTHYNWGWGGAEDGFYQEPKYKKNVKQLNLSK